MRCRKPGDITFMHPLSKAKTDTDGMKDDLRRRTNFQPSILSNAQKEKFMLNILSANIRNYFVFVKTNKNLGVWSYQWWQVWVCKIRIFWVLDLKSGMPKKCLRFFGCISLLRKTSSAFTLSHFADHLSLFWTWKFSSSNGQLFRNELST